MQSSGVPSQLPAPKLLIFSAPPRLRGRPRGPRDKDWLDIDLFAQKAGIIRGFFVAGPNPPEQ
jgi:hypothetical protein